VSSEGHRENLAKLDATDPCLAEILGAPDPAQLSGRAGLRCVTPDYLPLAGPALSLGSAGTRRATTSADPVPQAITVRSAVSSDTPGRNSTHSGGK
jgi:tRNA 5-methylaminomethyl-2-thiouridine biosynthesis bifunctional protein